MARRLGIILATMVVALLVMTDGAWACRCMNRLINRCGHRRACCQPMCCQPVCCQPACCQPVAMPACCQPVVSEMQPAQGAATIVSPSESNPAGASQGPDLGAVPAGKILELPPNRQPEAKPEPKPEPKPAPPPSPKAEPVESPAEPRVLKPIEVVKPVEPAKVPEPSKVPEKPAEVKPPEKAPEPPKVLEPPAAPAKAPEPAKIPEPPKSLEPPTAPAKAPEPAKIPEPPKILEPPATPAKAPEKAPKPPEKDNPFGSNNGNTLRMWTDASGKYQIEARFVSFQDGTVRLQKANGRYIRIVYDLLCAVDQTFVLNQDQSLLAGE